MANIESLTDPRRLSRRYLLRDAMRLAVLVTPLVFVGNRVIEQMQNEQAIYDIQSPPDGTEVEKDPVTGNYFISKNPPPVIISLVDAGDHDGNILPIPLRPQPVADLLEGADFTPPKKDIYGVRVIGGRYDSGKDYGNIRPIDPNHPGIELGPRGLWFRLTDSEGRPVTKEGKLVDPNDKNSKPAYVAANFVIVEQTTPKKPQ